MLLVTYTESTITLSKNQEVDGRVCNSNYDIKKLPFNILIMLHIMALIIIIIRFLINMQVQGHHSHQLAPFQVTG